MSITPHQVPCNDLSDLLQRARRGDSQAYCDLVQPLESRLYQQALALCGEHALAEDLVSETLVEGWRALSRFDGTCRLSTWLYAILVHRVQKALRRARSRPVPLSSLPNPEEGERGPMDTLPDTAPLPADRIIQRELGEALVAAIHCLPSRHQQVVLLRFYEQATLEEIASALGVSLGTVKSRLHHGLKKLSRMHSVLNLCDLGRDTKV